MGRLRADDDAAQRQGTGISRGVPRGHGGRAFPPPALQPRSGQPRGGAAALLFRAHPRHARALPPPRPTAPPTLPLKLPPVLALLPADTPGAALRAIASHPTPFA